MLPTPALRPGDTTQGNAPQNICIVDVPTLKRRCAPSPFGIWELAVTRDGSRVAAWNMEHAIWRERPLIFSAAPKGPLFPALRRRKSVVYL